MMKAALIVSIAFQLLAAIIAFSLTRKTKYNISWILISAAFLLIALRRMMDLIPIYYKGFQYEMFLLDRLLGIFISVLLLAGVVFIRKLFNFLKRIEDIRHESEKKVLQAIMQTEERERRQLAKDLHDGLGPLLSNIKMSVTALELEQISGFNRTVVENINTLVNEAITSLKFTSNNLSPYVLENFGLASAIHAFIENITRLGKIEIHFSHNLEHVRFDNSVETNLYRIVCELFQNTVKHAGAGNISLLLQYHDGRILMQYMDDGIGFDSSDPAKMNGMGISNMRSRLRAVNGDLSFKRIRPSGMMTSITLKAKQKTALHGKT